MDADDVAIQEGVCAIAHAVVDCGMARGEIPSPCSSGRMAVVACPADAVIMHYCGGLPPKCFGGLTISKVPPLKGLRDALVGWIVPHLRTFVWATADVAIHPGPDTVAAPPGGVAVWLTCCNHAHSVKLRESWTFRSPSTGALHTWYAAFTDALPPHTLPESRTTADARERARRRREFWQAARAEFVQKTWHPARVVQWCLDAEERADLGDDTPSKI